MSTLLEDVEKFIVNHFYENLDSSFVYHNLSHTQRVVEKTKEIIETETISESESQNLIIAAWFHDSGYTKTIKGHEEESALIARDFLKDKGLEEKDIITVEAIILATEMSYEPKTILGKIIRDADSSHVGSKNYADFKQLLRKEWEVTQDLVFTDEEWQETNIDFLMNHHQFYTFYAASKWEKQKGKSLASLLKTQNKTKLEHSKLKHKKEELAFKKSKVELPERGIETMFRVALRNHITLSDIADTKANILLSVNAIIISVALSNLLPKLDNPSNSYLIYPTLIFLVFTVASITMSVIATRPNVTRGKFNKEDVANKKVNLMFFGNFHKMSLPEFEWAMTEMMKDRDYLYGSLTKDLYFLGLVLNRKYNLLRHTYTVFMIGILISVIAFGVAFYLQSGGEDPRAAMNILSYLGSSDIT
ncbi:DUF5706 domain-containing protein [Ichthyenterobacterium sp. W332]|uniref:DUF5706 domain-containing protein n=1 Tax=Microcosmobacter mediterraneus TaxID=3075607 RepID=A0ABU2YL84_9FLAO|nr:Pycsar system effector family protein [Ichthyenterobacterium sp. W332]MDT0558921.1 DUF5706 domain-containing protein [Ichthyenterobacterium sp. W332]